MNAREQWKRASRIKRIKRTKLLAANAYGVVLTGDFHYCKIRNCTFSQTNVMLQRVLL